MKNQFPAPPIVLHSAKLSQLRSHCRPTAVQLPPHSSHCRPKSFRPFCSATQISHLQPPDRLPLCSATPISTPNFCPPIVIHYAQLPKSPLLTSAPRLSSLMLSYPNLHSNLLLPDRHPLCSATQISHLLPHTALPIPPVSSPSQLR
jgi:hypothetical protein